MASPRRVGDEAAALGIFQEAAGEPGIERVRADHRRREIVQHKVLRDAAQKSPGGLQPFDNVGQPLPKERPEKAMAGISEHGEHPQGLASPATARVVRQPQSAEVYLGHLARRGVRHADRRLRALAEPAPPADIAPQACVWHQTVLPCKHVLDPRERQLVLLDPLLDPVGPWLKLFIGG
jgi:hypothetical protein